MIENEKSEKANNEFVYHVQQRFSLAVHIWQYSPGKPPRKKKLT